MKQAILDTNFIIHCVTQKIDFFEELKSNGIQILIPIQVVNELKKNNADLALKLLEKEKHSFRKIDLKKGHVDKLIINYAKKHPEILVGTLDRDIKIKIKNEKIVIRNKKKLEII